MYGQLLQRIQGGGLLGLAPTFTAALYHQLRPGEATGHTELLVVIIARNPNQLILRQRAATALQVFLQAGLGVLVRVAGVSCSGRAAQPAAAH